MKFLAAGLPGAFIVEIERREDERGFFARFFCRDEFAAAGLETQFAQSSLSRNARRGTLRGLHFQAAPDAETKIVRCARGAIFDVIVDVRPESAAHRRWIGVELSADNGRALYIPAGFAHGFITLTDDCDVEYMISPAYVAASARGVRWDDPAFGIRWPLAPDVMSDRDRSFPDYAP